MDVNVGRGLRALRIRASLRQVDAGDKAHLSRSFVAKAESGAIDGITVGNLRRLAAVFGATVDVRLRWKGEGLDRLLDEAHSRLVDAIVVILRASGWEVAVEVSFSIWGERGSIDVLAFHRLTGILLVIEVKSVVPDSQATLHGLDRKARLAPQIAAERGWRAGPWLDSSSLATHRPRGAASHGSRPCTTRGFRTVEPAFVGGFDGRAGPWPASCSSHTPAVVALGETWRVGSVLGGQIRLIRHPVQRMGMPKVRGVVSAIPWWRDGEIDGRGASRPKPRLTGP